MPREGVTLADVKDAMAELDAERQSTSYRRIRAKLGEGSLTTIANHVHELQRQQDELPTDNKQPPLPEPVVQSLLAGASKTWEELLEAAEDIIAEANKAFEEKSALADNAAVQAVHFRAEADAENKRLSESLAEKESELTFLTKMSSTLKDAHQALQTKHEGVLGELESQKLLIHEVQNSNKQHIARVDKAKSVIGDLRKQIAKTGKDHQSVLAKQRHESEKQFQSLQVSNQKLTEKSAKLATTIDHLTRSAEDNLRSMREEFDTVVSKLDATSLELVSVVKETASLTERNTALRETLERRDSESALLLAAKDEHLADQDTLVKELRKEIATLRRKQDN